MMALLSPWCNDIKRQTEKREDGTNRLSIFSDLQELFVDRYVDGMTTQDLQEYVYNSMM